MLHAFLLQASSDISEIQALRVAAKTFGCMIQLLEVVSANGLESDNYKEAYDIVQTSLKLEPVVDLLMPPHLKYARHALDVRSTVSIERFLMCISSEALRDHGVQSVDVEQDIADSWPGVSCVVSDTCTTEPRSQKTLTSGF